MARKRYLLNKNLAIFYIILLICFLLYGFLDTAANVNIYNILIFAISLMLSFYGINDILSNGISMSNVFLVSFFVFLAANNFNIAGMQMEKNWIDMYYYFVGPLLFYFILSIPIKNHKAQFTLKRRGRPDAVVAVFLIIIVGIQIYAIQRQGLRFFDGSWRSEDAAQYSIAGVTGIQAVLTWTSLMLIPNIKKKLAVLTAVVSISIAVLNVSRGDMMREAVLIFIIWFGVVWDNIKKDNTQIEKKRIIRRAVIVLAVILGCFTIFGAYRTYKRGATLSNVQRMLHSRSKSLLINWIYAYTCINYDVLKYVYKTFRPLYRMQYFIMPLMRFIGGSDKLLAYRQSTYSSGLNGANASTFLGIFVVEMGPFYWVEVIVFAVILCVLRSLFRAFEFKGGEYFLIMATAMTCFGNILFTPVFFVAIPFALIVWIALCKD